VMAATIVHDTSEAVELFPPQGLYLKPIAKLTISVSLPQLKQPGKSISNWEVMERLKCMVHPEQFATLRVSKSTMDFVRFEGEVENKNMVKTFLSKLDGKTIKLSGFTDTLKVRAAEVKIDFPTRHDWDSFFRDAKDVNETLPGERPDTIHLEGLPCKWFSLKNSSSEKPSDLILSKVFGTFGEIRNVDIPMLDPYREEMTGKNFHTFSFGGHLNFEAYVQYQEYIGFVKAMDALRGMKLMYKGDDVKAVACSIKVTFDTTKHLTDASIKRRQQERQKLQELELRREEQKRREKEDEERRKEDERKQKELEEQEREKKREEKVRKREQKQKEREDRRNTRKLQREEQKRLQEKIALEERKLILVQRNLESIRLISELLSRAKVMFETEAEAARRHQVEEKRRQQEAELLRVEEEKHRVVELQLKEKELREKLLENLRRKEASEGQREEPGAQPTEQGTVGTPGVEAVWPSTRRRMGSPVRDSDARRERLRETGGEREPKLGAAGEGTAKPAQNGQRASPQRSSQEAGGHGSDTSHPCHALHVGRTSQGAESSSNAHQNGASHTQGKLQHTLVNDQEKREDSKSSDTSSSSSSSSSSSERSRHVEGLEQRGQLSPERVEPAEGRLQEGPRPPGQEPGEEPEAGAGETGAATGTAETGGAEAGEAQAGSGKGSGGARAGDGETGAGKGEEEAAGGAAVTAPTRAGSAPGTGAPAALTETPAEETVAAGGTVAGITAAIAGSLASNPPSSPETPGSSEISTRARGLFLFPPPPYSSPLPLASSTHVICEGSGGRKVV
uniref:A kinase (PRKA) anchor protein 17A n=1 Tax=Callorhinchus milii TaxID=7868 RepID=A0A4W3J6G4_CALMI